MQYNPKIGQDINKAISLLKEGKLVSIPTETVYGLAGNGLNENALINIYKVKNRPTFDPLILHVGSFNLVSNYVSKIPEVFWQLSEKFSPGPLTYILPKNNLVSDIVTSGLSSVAIRVPDHSITLKLLNSIDFPLAAPSANKFGKLSPTSPLHVINQLGVEVDYVLDGGDCKIGVESTIIEFKEDKIIVLRVGGISIEDIQHTLSGINVEIYKESNIVAPGQIRSHYATKTPLIIGEIEKLIIENIDKKIAVLSFSDTFKEIPITFQRKLSDNKNLDEAAKNLFSTLYELDLLQADLIITEIFPDYGLGRAINDRLKRASYKEDFNKYL